jgi:hypothetical protein
MDSNFEQEFEAAASQLEGQEEYGDLNLTPEMEEQIRQIESLAKFDEEFANSQEYQDLMASLRSGQAASSGEEEEYEEEEEDEDEEEDDDSDDVFGITKPTKSVKEVKINFQPPAEMVNMLSSKYGMKDAGKFFTSVDTWRNQAQEGVEIKKEYEALTSDLQALPPEVRMSIELWANGDDYTRAFSMQQRLDFESNFGEQEVEGLVQHYLPEQYADLNSALDKGKIDDDEFEERLTMLAASTKRLFNDDKKALEEQREQYVNKQRNHHQNLKKTASLSVENLSKTYPNFSKSEVSKIRNVLVDGKIEQMFYNSDGTYNDNAAELVAYAMYGKKMMESVMKVAERKGESRANQKIVDSSPKTIRRQKSSNETRGLGMDAVGHLNGVFRGDPYASK